MKQACAMILTVLLLLAVFGTGETTNLTTDATAITDLDNPVVGSFVTIIGGSATNSSTIADSGNFSLAGAFTAGLNDTLTLYVVADNNYAEVSRADN